MIFKQKLQDFYSWLDKNMHDVNYCKLNEKDIELL
jgi:hypothetical protein